ncbi:MAG TPA: RraA family protein [Gaiellaceae bacterium]|nr:RraA family protein [Gaiellaceae bacterium]
MAEGRDLQLVDRLERLFTAVVSDCLDAIGIRSNVLQPHVRPLFPEARTAGFAATARCVEVDRVPEREEDLYRGLLETVDRLRAGDVLVVSRSRAAVWGELLATAAAYRGARGVVADAYARDTRALIEMRFPVFVAGISCQDALGRVEVEEIGVPVECGGVRVEPGDLVLADHDGVVVVPAGVAPEVVARAEEKASGESLVRRRLAAGMSVAEAFRTYGVI